jgi:mono/diheme cytochrome c family protein
LTEEGRRRRPDFILGKIKDPQATNPTSTMPKQELTDHQRLALTTFLKAQQGSRISRAPLQQFVSAQQARPEWLEVGVIAGPEAAQAMAAQTAAKRGEMLLPKAGCLSCHKLGEVDGRVGPDIDYASGQRDFPWLMAHFKDPRSVVPGSIMPPYPLPADAFVALSDYLVTRPMPAVPDDPAEEYKALCARCHGEKGAGDGLISRYLDPRPRDLTKAAFMKSKSHDRLVGSVMNGVPGTSMAPWGRVLGQGRSTRLVDYVLENISKGGTARVATNRKVPTLNPVAYSAESTARGEAIFLDRCWGCHGKKADGHGPNAVDIWPRPRNLRNKPFVTAASYERLHESIKYGVQGSAMPAAGFDFNLDDKAIGDVINYIHGMNGLGGAASRAAQVPTPPATTTAREGGEKSHER